MTRSEEIKTLLHQDLEAALIALSEEAKGTRYESTGIIFMAEFNGMKPRIMAGMMSIDAETRKKASLIYRASSLIESLERDYPDRMNLSVSNAPDAIPVKDTSDRTVNNPDNISAEKKTGSLKAFVSYAEKDEAFRDEFDKYLKLMRDSEILATWENGKVYAGQVWDSKIRNYLQEADVIFLLISIDFMTNDKIRTKELPVALNRHEQGKARVIPIILQECPWEKQGFAKLQAANKQALGEADNHLGWTQIYMEISLSLQNFRKE